MPQPVVSFEIIDHEILKKQDYVVSKHYLIIRKKQAKLWLISYISRLSLINFLKFHFDL